MARASTAIQIFPGPTLVAMVGLTKIGLFLYKIGHNSVYTNARAAKFKGDLHQVISLFAIFAFFDVSDRC